MEVVSLWLMAIKLAELVLCEGPQISVMFSVKHYQTVLIEELHGQSTIVGQHGAQSLEPFPK